MERRARLVEGAIGDAVLSVDGALDAPGLNLSHWPGHRTPEHLRHALSTGSALAFARLGATERAALTKGLAFVANNHYDTDGLLAAFAVLNPERALELERPLLDTAATGDFFALPSEHAFALDHLIGLLPDPTRSPIAERLIGTSDLERRQLALDYGLEHVDGWLAEPLDGPAWRGVRACVTPALDRLRADLVELDRAERFEDSTRDLVHFVARAPASPGRHALFGRARSDRVLISAPLIGGTAHRLVIGTRSWFDLPDDPNEPRPGPRFDLAVMANTLARAEPAQAALGWRHQPSASPSPELWFGAAKLDMFAEHNTSLGASALPAAAVRAAIPDAR